MIDSGGGGAAHWRSNERPGVVGVFLRRDPGYAALGFVLVPVIVLFAVLIMGFVTPPSCCAGTDSGGCAMGAAVCSTIPGAVLSVLLAAWRSFRR